MSEPKKPLHSGDFLIRNGRILTMDEAVGDIPRGDGFFMSTPELLGPEFLYTHGTELTPEMIALLLERESRLASARPPTR